MFRRLTLTLTLAAVMVAALSVAPAVAQPIDDPADARCLQLARQTFGFGPELNPGNTNFIGGTEGEDDFSDQGIEGRDVFCGFSGYDVIGTLDEGDIFLGGAGLDAVFYNYGTFYGGEGNDQVLVNYGTGTFYGGEGSDDVHFDHGGRFVQ